MQLHRIAIRVVDHVHVELCCVEVRIFEYPYLNMTYLLSGMT
jgi:hypothetical protein